MAVNYLKKDLHWTLKNWL